MDEDQGVKLVRDGKKPIQAPVGQLDNADLGTDLDTEESRLTHAPPHLVDGAIGVLQGDRAERGEAGWVPTHDAGEELILGRRQFCRTCCRRPVAERHWNR